MGASFGVVQAVQEVFAVRIGFVEALSNRRLFHVGTNFKRDIFSPLIEEPHVLAIVAPYWQCLDLMLLEMLSAILSRRG
jgi:hypothetical protein